MALILHGACPGVAHAHSHGGASSSHSHAHSHDVHTHSSYSDMSKAKNGYRNLGMDSAENGTVTSGGNGSENSAGLLGIIQMPKKNAFGSMNGEYALKDANSHQGANGSGNGYSRVHAGDYYEFVLFY